MRLKRILEKLVTSQAPHIMQPGWDKGKDEISALQFLARKLADHGVLVMKIPASIQAAAEVYVQDTVNLYARLYRILSQSLFPSLSKLNIYYADDRTPPVVVMIGDATPIFSVMAGYVVPYLAIRQATGVINELELIGLMDVVLGELEASDLPQMVYREVRANAVDVLKSLLGAQVEHVSLTSFDKPILNTKDLIVPLQKRQTGRLKPPPPPPPSLPQQQAKIKYDLETLPEDNQPQTPTERMFRTDIKLPRGEQNNSNRGGRKPPVPPLPFKDDD
ncbi:MAG: hypothetical protein Kow00117_20900 [Phototrophicales bacterium]